jgi:hypothetical protein
MKILSFYLCLTTNLLILCYTNAYPYEKKIPEENNDSHYYRDRDGIRRYAHLHAHGNYSKLKLIVRSDKKEYSRGEAVFIKFWVRNDSEEVIHIYDVPVTKYCIFLWKLTNYQQRVVPYTSLGKKYILTEKKNNEHGIDFGSFGKFLFRKLQPNEEMELSISEVELNKNWDISFPDTYQLTCGQINFMSHQKYDPPLQSNTLTFRVLDKPLPKNEQNDQTDKKRENSSAEFTNPPRGEEIFEQKKEPKNIFFKPNTAGEVMDISPHVYYQQRAETKKKHEKKENKE